MTDIQGLRAQLRDTRPTTRSSSVSSSGGGGGIPFWAIAAGAAALGFAIVLFTPRFYTTQRTAALPDVQSAQRTEGAESAHAVAPATAPHPAVPHAAASHAAAPEQQAVASRYAGKAPEEVVRTVEIVCDERARMRASAGTPGPKGVDERLHCFLTEAPARFCAPNLKRKATADVINYFKGIEYTNTALSMAAKLKGTTPDPAAGATIDPRVVEAIEGLIRAGYLTKGHRDEIAANVPRDIKERLARLVGSTPACPKPPWWASLF
jgi:hypothetical protein